MTRKQAHFSAAASKGTSATGVPPAPYPTEAKRAGDFFLLSPFWAPSSEERRRLSRDIDFGNLKI